MRRLALAALVIATVSCTPSASTGTAADEQAIRDFGTRWDQAWNKGDSKAVAAMVADNYESIDASGVHQQGRDAFERATAAFLASRPVGSTLTISTGYVKWLSASSAVAGGGWVVNAPDQQPSRGSWMSTFQKIGGSWLLSSTLDASAPPSMPMASDTSHVQM